MPDVEWGPVRITRGEYAGRVGYYDDDDENGLAIVYLGNFENGERAFVRKSSLEQLPEGSGQLVIKRLHPHGES